MKDKFNINLFSCICIATAYSRYTGNILSFNPKICDLFNSVWTETYLDQFNLDKVLVLILVWTSC